MPDPFSDLVPGGGAFRELVPADPRAAEEEELRLERLRQQVSAANAEATEEPGPSTEGERKAVGFALTARRSNDSYNELDVSPPSFGRRMAQRYAGDDITNMLTATERQQSEALERDFIAATLRQESGAAIPDHEIENQRRRYFPQPFDAPETVELKRQIRQTAIDGLVVAAGGSENIAGWPDTPPDLSALGRDVGQEQIAVTGAEGEYDPVEAEQFIRGLMAQGIPGTEVADRANERYPSRLMSAEDPGLQYYEQNRNNPGFNQETIPVNVNAIREGEEEATGAGTFGRNYLEGASLGLTARLASDEQREAMALEREANSGSALAGSVAGLVSSGVPIARAGGALAARALPEAVTGTQAMAQGGRAALTGGQRAGRTAGITAEGVGEGAVYGANVAPEGERLRGAMQGGLAGGTGALAGNALMGGLRRGAAPNVSDDVKLLRSGGVDTTVGQSSGGAMANIENRATSLLGVGNQIAARQREGLDQFQLGAINMPLEAIGRRLPDDVTTGKEAMRYLGDSFDEAYESARAGMRLEPDQQMVTELGELLRRASDGELSTDSARRLESMMRQRVVDRLESGVADGNTYKAIRSNIGELASRSTDRELGGFYGELQGIIDDAARRSSPPEATAAMSRIDSAYGDVVAIQRGAGSAGGDTGTFTPAQLRRGIRGNDRTARGRRTTEGRGGGLQEFADAGQRVLPNKVPVGSADRTVPLAQAAGAVAAPATVVPAIAVGMGAYTRAGQKGLNTVFTGERPAMVDAFGRYVGDRRRIGATPAAAGALSYYGPQY